MRLYREGFSSFCLFFLSFVTGGLAVAGTFNDDFNDDEIDKEFWVIYEESPTGRIEETNGRIEVTDLSGGWDGVGMRFDQPIDLTKGKFTLEFDMLLRNTDGHAYFSSTAVETGLWDPPLFAFNGIFSGGKTVWQFETNADPSVAPPFEIAIDQEDFYHYKVELTPTDDNVSISSPSIQGIIGHKEAVESSGKLTATWGQIKAIDS